MDSKIQDALLSAYHALSEVEMHWRPSVVTEATLRVHDVLVEQGILIVQPETGQVDFRPPQPIGAAAKRAMNAHKRK